VGKVSAVLTGRRKPSREVLAKLQQVVNDLEVAERTRAERSGNVLAAVRARCEQFGVRGVAREAGGDPGTLAKILSSQPRMSQVTLAKLEALLPQ
jgi:hypothetical protein